MLRITNKTEAKTMLKHISCDCECKFNSATCFSNQKWNNETCPCECKVIVHARKIIVGILAHVFLKIVSIEKILLMIQKLCVMNVMDIVSTEMTNTIATNVSTNSDGKKVRYKMDCYILHTVLLVITLSMIITIICYHYAKLKNILPC